MARQMKDSGVEWIGEMPEAWEVINPKALFRLRKEKAALGQRQLTSSQQYGIVYQDEYMKLTGAKVVTVEKDFEILKQVESGDFVISMRSFQGGIEYSPYSGSISSAYVMLIPNKNCVYSPFYKWLLKSSEYIRALQSTSNMVRDGQAMRYSNFAQVRLIVLPMEEQRRIANYLDSKCAEIDKVVEQTRATIEEYKKLKQAIITEAVTKGVRGPRSMKPSGVEWIGDIPAEWALTKLKYNSILSPKSSPPCLHAEDCVTFTPMENIKNGFYIPNDAAFGRFTGNSQYAEYEENDIVFAKVTPCFENDNIAIMSNLTNGRGFGSSELFVIRALNIELHYLYYVLRTSLFKSKGIESMTGTGGLKRVSSGVVRNYNFAMPPKDEQQEISTYLDTKCAEIDRIIEKKEQLIEELGSYKKSLIYEYVTGKKEVKA